MDIFISLIYKWLWQLIHFIASLYEFCLWVRLRIIAFAQWSYDLYRKPEIREQNEYDFLEKCKKNLNKIPKHLNLIIGPENTQADDELLVRIFTYAIRMNMNCISYYDTRYTNATNKSKPRVSALEKLTCPKGWKRKNINAHHSVWYICKDRTSNGTTHMSNGSSNVSTSLLTNGHLDNSLSSSTFDNASIEIYEIQPHNNRSLLAQICRDLFKERHTTEIQSLLERRSLLTDRLNRELAHHLGNLTEPELSIVFSNDICTFGMLPWHTRFTEFHQHANGQHFDVKTFARILHKYSRCEQRWGK